MAVTTPYGPGVTQEEMYRHYEQLARATRLPLAVKLSPYFSSS